VRFSSMIETRLAISFMAATASTTDLPLSCASVADLLAILSVCAALSAFCLMLENHLLHRRGCFLGRGRLRTGALGYLDRSRADGLAGRGYFAAMERMSDTTRVMPLYHRSQRLHELVLRRPFAKRYG